MTNTQKAEALLQDITKRFSEKEFADDCAKVFIHAQDVPSAAWSLGNQLLMFFNGTTDARGYRQWGKVHRHVKKGTKAVYILTPVTKKIKEKKKAEDGTELPEEIRIITVGFKCVPVFRYEDTEGTSLEDYIPKRLPPLYGLAQKNGIDVRYKNTTQGEYGSMNPITKTMTLSTESPDTFLHEMIHWYDNKNQKLKPGQDPEQETVAQLGACVLAKMYGYDAEAYSWRYIASYVDSDKPQKVGQMCFRVLGRVQKAINEILADAEEIAEVNSGILEKTHTQSASCMT